MVGRRPRWVIVAEVLLFFLNDRICRRHCVEAIRMSGNLHSSSSTTLRVDLYSEVRQLSILLGSARRSIAENESHLSLEVNGIETLMTEEVSRLQKAIDKWAGLEDRIRTAAQGDNANQVSIISGND